MNPFFFGPSERPLFGVYSQARNVSGSPDAVLLCYPIMGEYLRAHRAFRQLNNLLTRAGVSVLRFDYSCTGDSWGRGEEARLETWLEDVDWAIDELRDMVGAPRVSIVGLRFGGAIAALAARGRDDVKRLVLWDPIVSGEQFIREATKGQAPPSGKPFGVEGIPVTAELRADLEDVDLLSLEGVAGRRTEIVVSTEEPAYEELARNLRVGGDEVHVEVVPSSGSWTEADPFGSAYIPEQIIRTIVDKLTEPAGTSA
jgi:uncharacterized protein